MKKDKNTGEILIAAFDSLNYYHKDETMVALGLSAYEAYCEITKDTPFLVRSAFFIRDKISALAGVKKIKGFSNIKPTQVPKIGEYLDFFMVEHISKDEIALTSRDKHLSVMIFIQMKKMDNEKQKLTLVASVINHNFFGYLYMLPVAPAHKIIVASTLKKVAYSEPKKSIA